MSENPYVSPKSPGGKGQPRDSSAGRIAYFILILLLAIPASLSAALALCFVTGAITLWTTKRGHDMPLIVGLVAGTITGVFVFYLFLRYAIKLFGARKSPDSQQGRAEAESGSQIPADTN